MTRARTVLQKARIKLPQSEEVWLHSIRLELQSGNEKIAQHLLSRALQACPESGKLWPQAIDMEPQQTRMSKSTDAVKKVKDSPYVFTAIGKNFWAEHKPLKARKFLERALEFDKDLADSWLYLIAFESEYDQSAVPKLKEDFATTEPKHGELWQSYAKKVENWRKSHLEILGQIHIPRPKLFK